MLDLLIPTLLLIPRILIGFGIGYFVPRILNNFVPAYASTIGRVFLGGLLFVTGIFILTTIISYINQLTNARKENKPIRYKNSKLIIDYTGTASLAGGILLTFLVYPPWEQAQIMWGAIGIFVIIWTIVVLVVGGPYIPDNRY